MRRLPALLTTPAGRWTSANCHGAFTLRIAPAALAATAVSGVYANLEADSYASSWFFTTIRHMVRATGWFGGSQILHPRTVPPARNCAPEAAGSHFSAEVDFVFNANRQICRTNDAPTKARQLVAKP
jgi:hypothetical protein